MFLPRGSRSMSLLHARPCMFPPAICRRRGNVASGTLTALLGTNHPLETVTRYGFRCLLVPRSFMASNGMVGASSTKSGGDSPAFASCYGTCTHGHEAVRGYEGTLSPITP